MTSHMPLLDTVLIWQACFCVASALLVWLLSCTVRGLDGKPGPVRAVTQRDSCYRLQRMCCGLVPAESLAVLPPNVPRKQLFITQGRPRTRKLQRAECPDFHARAQWATSKHGVLRHVELGRAPDSVTETVFAAELESEDVAAAVNQRFLIDRAHLTAHFVSGTVRHYMPVYCTGSGRNVLAVQAAVLVLWVSQIAWYYQALVASSTWVTSLLQILEHPLGPASNSRAVTQLTWETAQQLDILGSTAIIVAAAKVALALLLGWYALGVARATRAVRLTQMQRDLQQRSQSISGAAAAAARQPGRLRGTRWLCCFQPESLSDEPYSSGSRSARTTPEPQKHSQASILAKLVAFMVSVALLGYGIWMQAEVWYAAANLRSASTSLSTERQLETHVDAWKLMHPMQACVAASQPGLQVQLRELQLAAEVDAVQHALAEPGNLHYTWAASLHSGGVTQWDCAAQLAMTTSQHTMSALPQPVRAHLSGNITMMVHQLNVGDDDPSHSLAANVAERIVLHALCAVPAFIVFALAWRAYQSLHRITTRAAPQDGSGGAWASASFTCIACRRAGSCAGWYWHSMLHGRIMSTNLRSGSIPFPTDEWVDTRSFDVAREPRSKTSLSVFSVAKHSSNTKRALTSPALEPHNAANAPVIASLRTTSTQLMSGGVGYGVGSVSMAGPEPGAGGMIDDSERTCGSSLNADVLLRAVAYNPRLPTRSTSATQPREFNTSFTISTLAPSYGRVYGSDSMADLPRIKQSSSTLPLGASGDLGIARAASGSSRAPQQIETPPPNAHNTTAMGGGSSASRYAIGSRREASPPPNPRNAISIKRAQTTGYPRPGHLNAIIESTRVASPGDLAMQRKPRRSRTAEPQIEAAHTPGLGTPAISSQPSQCVGTPVLGSMVSGAGFTRPSDAYLYPTRLRLNSRAGGGGLSTMSVVELGYTAQSPVAEKALRIWKREPAAILRQHVGIIRATLFGSMVLGLIHVAAVLELSLRTATNSSAVSLSSYYVLFVFWVFALPMVAVDMWLALYVRLFVDVLCAQMPLWRCVRKCRGCCAQTGQACRARPRWGDDVEPGPTVPAPLTGQGTVARQGVWHATTEDMDPLRFPGAAQVLCGPRPPAARKLLMSQYSSVLDMPLGLEDSELRESSAPRAAQVIDLTLTPGLPPRAGVPTPASYQAVAIDSAVTCSTSQN